MPATTPREKKDTRRARGTGTVFFDESREVWVGRKIAGKKPDGGPRYVERSHANQERMLKLLEEAGPPGPDTTVKQYLERWLEEMECRPNTRTSRANSATNHITPVLGGQKLATLAVSQVNDAVKKWAAAGQGPNSVRLILSHLQTCLAEAARAGLRPDNPAQLARKPKGVKAKIDPFPPDELALIIAEAGRSASTHPIALLAGTGCRVGEAFALDCPEFDPATGHVSINRTSNQKRESGPPKSPHSVRTIRAPRNVVPILAAARGGRSEGALFRSERGARRINTLLRRSWAFLCQRLGLRFRNLHQLRHSVATAMISAGAPLGDVAAYLGDTVETIVRTYLHATGADPSVVMDRLLYGGRKVEAKPPRVQKCSIFRRSAVL